MFIDISVLSLSLVILFFGAEFALNASEKIGERLGLSPMVIGMLLVGFGTSLPEFFVSHLACLQNQPGIALGNIVGSNLGNLLLILGVTGMIVTLPTSGPQMRQTFIAHIIVTALLALALNFETVNPWTTTILFVYFFFYLFKLYVEQRKMKQTDSEIEAPDRKVTKNDALQFFKMIVGFYGLYFGGELLVTSGTSLCTRLGWPPYIISAIFVAFGTSFPELVTSLVACYQKKETELILGNVIGSNIFNVAFVLGSLGIYHFPIERDFTIELTILGVLAMHLFIAGSNRIAFGKKSAAVYLTGYIALVLYWMNSV